MIKPGSCSKCGKHDKECNELYGKNGKILICRYCYKLLTAPFRIYFPP